MPLLPLEAQILAGLAAGKTLAQIGEELSLSHSALSKALHGAEQREGLAFVQQNGRRLQLSPAGRYLLPHIRQVMAALSELDERLAAVQSGSAGPLRVASTRSAGLSVLPAILEGFREVFPQAAIEHDIVPAREVCDVLRGGRYDVAIGPLHHHAPDLLADRLYEDDPVFFAPAGSRLAGKESIATADLRDETLIGPFALPFWASLWEVLTQGEPAAAIRKMPVTDIDRVKQLVRTGTGIGVLFETSIRRELEDGTFARLPLDGATLPHELYVIRRAGVARLPIVEQFRNFVIGRTRR